MNTHENLTGQTRGTLRIQGIARRVPSLAWTCTCTVCGTSTVYEHRHLTQNASCKNASCGRPAEPVAPSRANIQPISTAARSAVTDEARRAGQQQRQQIVETDPMLENYNNYVRRQRNRA